MPGTYRARGIVLRRTKLGEQDLIVTLLGDAPGQLRVVAKGARKPGSRLAGLVNLGNEVDLLVHCGRGLHTAAEGQLVVARTGVARELERAAACEAMLDVACELTVEGEHNRLLLPLTSTALDAACAAGVERLPLVAGAYVLKAAAMQGYRPSLDICVLCGEPVDAAGPAGFSLFDGGAVCPSCLASAALPAIDPVLLGWLRSLLGMRFADLLAMGPFDREARLGLDVLSFARTWLGQYPGVRPRALDFMLDQGLWTY